MACDLKMMSLPPSKWTFILGISIMGMIIMMQTKTTNATNATSIDKICESLQKNDTDNPNILLIGRTSSGRILLITKDFYVYDVSIGSPSINQVNLPMPISMEKKYPKFYSDKRFVAVKDNIFNAWIVNDKSGDWICINTRNDTGKLGVNYNIDDSQVIDGWRYFDQPKQVYISTVAPCKFYCIRHSTLDKGLLIQKYGCLASGGVRDHKAGLGPIDDQFANICYSDQSKTKILIETSPNCSSKYPVKWPVLNGFVSNGQFYLFCGSFIYAFDEGAYNHQGFGYPVTNNSYKSFFNCKNMGPFDQGISTAYVQWIIMPSVVLIVVLSIMIWFIVIICRRCRQPSRRSRRSSTYSAFKSSSRKSGSKSKRKSRSRSHGHRSPRSPARSKRHSNSSPKPNRSKRLSVRIRSPGNRGHHR
ncbi:uncharacterized protein LOC113794663 isoform X1 [Dermatophagoides pteronyssinus]|uniref:uncharacterized protein LOC113794663 isoform X1 n=1 Tax=Dermatophagoides pteronyssinus TaxID=6956 RepID=UPI003F671BB9